MELPPQGPGSIVRHGRRVVVDTLIRRRTRPRLPAIRASGARILDVTPSLRTITVAALPEQLAALAEVGGVQTVMEDLEPGVSFAGAARRGVSCQGSIVSEGDSILRADDARNAASVDGTGVTVGVVSDSYDHATADTDAAADMATHDLPGAGDPCGHTAPVTTIDDSAVAGATDEGRAMLQIVHDLAPGAQLDFATGYPTFQAFAANIQALAAAGADVIVDDLYYFNEPMFQDGPVAAAANAAAAAGVTYVSAAGNENVSSNGSSYSSFEATAFRDSGSCPAGVPASAQHCMDFDESEENTDNASQYFVLRDATLVIDLQWAQPWFGVSTDLNAYVVNDQGDLLASAEDVNVHGKAGSTEKPFEFLTWHNDTGTTAHVQIAIDRCSTTCRASGGDSASPRLKTQLLFHDGARPEEYAFSFGDDIFGPSIFGHGGTSGVISVAAKNARAASTSVEPYSSHGPVTLYFGPVNGTTAAAPLGSPQVLAKPDITASDCVSNTFFGAPSTIFGDDHAFCGTSAAAPHDAAIAALQLDADPSLTPPQIVAAQIAGAEPFGPADESGAGLLNARASILPDDPPGPPVTSIDSHPKAKTTQKKATFAFSTTVSATFQCQVDQKGYNTCVSPSTYSVKPGKHKFEVRATDDLSQTGDPASFSWTVKRKHRH